MRNCTIYTNSDSGLYGSGIDVSTNAFTADVKSGGVLSFIDNTIYTRDTPAHAILIRNYGYSGDPWDVVIDGLTIIETGTVISPAAAVRIRRHALDSGDAPRSIRFTNIGVHGGFRVPLDTFYINVDETKIKTDPISGSFTLDLTAADRFVDSPTVNFFWWFP